MRWALFVLLVGCGRVAFDARDDAARGDGDGAITGDGRATSDAPEGTQDVDFSDDPAADVTDITTDTALDTISAGANYGGRGTLELTQQRVPLIRFDLSAIPTTAIVTSAEMTLVTVDDATTDELTAFRVLEAWTEGTGDGTAGAANYLSRQTGVFWLGPGAVGLSRGTGTVASFVPNGMGTSFLFALTPATVQDWVSFPATNVGLVFDSSGTDAVRFYSSEASLVMARPRLRVVYTIQ